jgi:glutamate dehydrogenase
VSVACWTHQPIDEVARVFFEVGERLRLDWVQDELNRIAGTSRMQRWALQAVREDAFQVRRELAAAILSSAGGDLDKFLEDRAGRVARLTAFLRSLAREGDPDLAGLTLAVRQLRSIVD